MRNLLVWQKLALLGAVFLLPLVVVTYALISSVNSLGIATARLELLGVEYNRPLLALLRDLQRFRGFSAAGLEEERGKVRGDIERDLAALEAADLRLRSPLKLKGESPMLADQVRALVASPPGPSAVDDSTSVIRQGLDLLKRIGDNSALTLDPEIGSYYFMDLFL